MELKGNYLTSKEYYSPDLNISLQFSKQGGLSGEVHLFPNLSNVKKELRGLYHIHKGKVKLSFIIESTDPSLSDSFGCSSGEIFNYTKNHQCMILRWVAVPPSIPDLRPLFDVDISVLFDRELSDPVREITKAASEISTDRANRHRS